MLPVIYFVLACVLIIHLLWIYGFDTKINTLMNYSIHLFLSLIYYREFFKIAKIAKIINLIDFTVKMLRIFS